MTSAESTSRLNLDRHRGRRALITGGSKGIGRSIAERLGAEGAEVAICARNADELHATKQQLETAGISVLAQAADVTSAADIIDFVDTAAARMGGIDYVVNNAGGAAPGNFDSLTDEAWYRDIDTKVMSMIRVTRAALPHLRASDRGRVINIGAIYGRSPDPRFFATSTLRAACLALTKTLAMQLAPDGVLVNIVNVGFITTPQWDNIHQRVRPGSSWSEFESSMVSEEVPLGRFGTVSEVSPLVSLLCSDEGQYITGASIDVAGGMGRYV